MCCNSWYISLRSQLFTKSELTLFPCSDLLMIDVIEEIAGKQWNYLPANKQQLFEENEWKPGVSEYYYAENIFKK